jgi:hypothetical protein
VWRDVPKYSEHAHDCGAHANKRSERNQTLNITFLLRWDAHMGGGDHVVSCPSEYAHDYVGCYHTCGGHDDDYGDHVHVFGEHGRNCSFRVADYADHAHAYGVHAHQFGVTMLQIMLMYMFGHHAPAQNEHAYDSAGHKQRHGGHNH